MHRVPQSVALGLLPLVWIASAAPGHGQSELARVQRILSPEAESGSAHGTDLFEAYGVDRESGRIGTSPKDRVRFR